MSGDQSRKDFLRIVPEARKSLEVTAKPTVQKPEGEGAVCPLCFGTGMRVEPGKGARRCECRKQDRQVTLLEAARIPQRYQRCSLSDKKDGDIEYQAAGHETSKWAAKREADLLYEDYPLLAAEGRGLLFMGPVGVGKTHLAVAILRGLIDRYGITGLFYQFGILLKEIQDSYNPISQTSEFGVLAPVYEADVLVLDELGSSKPTDWVAETMMQIINTRYNDRKLTIFTTNYLDKRAEEKEKTLEDRIGVRLRSRLYEMCKTVQIEGEDFRKRFDKRSG